MTREKAEDEILERLDEIQQILREYDPFHGDDYFSATIQYGEIRFNNDYWSDIQKPLDYVEGYKRNLLCQLEEVARRRHRCSEK